MGCEAKFMITCDAPLCAAKMIHEAPTVEGVNLWDQRELDGKEVFGCCPSHLAAAILEALGFHTEAEILVVANRPGSVLRKEDEQCQG